MVLQLLELSYSSLAARQNGVDRGGPRQLLGPPLVYLVQCVISVPVGIGREIDRGKTCRTWGKLRFRMRQMTKGMHKFGLGLKKPTKTTTKGQLSSLLFTGATKACFPRLVVSSFSLLNPCPWKDKTRPGRPGRLALVMDRKVDRVRCVLAYNTCF